MELIHFFSSKQPVHFSSRKDASSLQKETTLFEWIPLSTPSDNVEARVIHLEHKELSLTDKKEKS
jgi:hypothetical protein